MNDETILKLLLLLLNDVEHLKEFIELHKQRVELTREFLQPYETGYFEGANDIIDYFKTSFSAIIVALDDCKNDEGLFLEKLEQRVNDRKEQVKKMRERVDRLKNESGNA